MKRIRETLSMEYDHSVKGCQYLCSNIHQITLAYCIMKHGSEWVCVWSNKTNKFISKSEFCLYMRSQCLRAVMV